MHVAYQTSAIVQQTSSSSLGNGNQDTPAWANDKDRASSLSCCQRVNCKPRACLQLESLYANKQPQQRMQRFDLDVILLQC